MHNKIMAAGLRDRLPMLATRRYAQWQSRFLRYIDTRPNSDALRKCMLEAVETILTMSRENKAHYESEKEAIHMLLTGIGDEIYSTIDACKTAHEMWIAIERLQQGESLNIQDVKTNLFWEFGKFTSHDGESMESYYSRFYKMMNEMIRNNLTVATIQVVNEIRAERVAKNANPLALVAAASSYPDLYYQAPKSHKPYAPTSKQASSTRSNASTKHKGKEIAKPITPPSESASEEDRRLKPKRVKDSTYHKGVILQVEQADWLEDTDEEIDEKELQHSEQPESTSNTCLVEKDDTNVTPDSPDMCDNDIQTDQNDEYERAALANLIANLKLDVDENKKIQEQLKKANASLAHELKE
ncbi:hypothetical protein Tco_1354027 [Tanacetum coccineum]